MISAKSLQGLFYNNDAFECRLCEKILAMVVIESTLVKHNKLSCFDEKLKRKTIKDNEGRFCIKLSIIKCVF
jgi:hypothetical protein